MKLSSASHNHGDVIVRHGFPKEWQSLVGTLEAMEIPLRPLKGFTTDTRPKEPKRHIRTIGSKRLPFLLPVDQSALNKTIETALRKEGWSSQPVAAGDFATGETPLSLKGDFFRNSVFVEVEFGNIASMHRDFFKFQIASRANAEAVAVLIVATGTLAKYFDSGVTTFEAAVRHIPYLAMGIQMPIWIVGLEPSDLTKLQSHYDQMHHICMKHGVEAHPFESTKAYAVKEDEADYEIE